MAEQLLVPAWIKIMHELSLHPEITATKIAKNLDITYSHVTKIIGEFENMGLIKTKRKGRTIEILLIGEGIAIAKDVDSLFYKIAKLNGDGK
jgi:DNA-binding MarR family transcriptional regulator